MHRTARTAVFSPLRLQGIQGWRLTSGSRGSRRQPLNDAIFLRTHRPLSNTGKEEGDSLSGSGGGRNLSVAIVGTGPSGFYTAKYLRSAVRNSDAISAVDIDLIERLPTPFGLVRSGVAPDHPEVKNVQNDFAALFDKATDESGDRSSIEFVGNVTVGEDVSLAELRTLYDAVVLAYGCESDRKLGIEGEDTLRGVLSAREFVAWYNVPGVKLSETHLFNVTSRFEVIRKRRRKRIIDHEVSWFYCFFRPDKHFGVTASLAHRRKKHTGHPDFVHIGDEVSDLLSHPEDAQVVVVGQGNVALDCARILAKGKRGLFDTDIASHALPIIKDGVRSTVVLGRRGHVQGAFTIKELRELTKLEKEGYGASFFVREDELNMGATPASVKELSGPGSRPRVRIDKLLRDVASSSWTNEGTGSSKQVSLRFLLNPVQFLPDKSDPSKVGSVVCERTELKGEPGKQVATGTGHIEHVPANLVLVSIGYKGVPLPGLEDAFDEKRGIAKNQHGKVVGDSSCLQGLYVSGWLKRGPSGIIGTNIVDAKETVARIVADVEQGDTFDKAPGVDAREALSTLLQERGTKVIDWSSYQRIDAAEKDPSRRRSDSQPREKLITLDEMLQFG